MNAEKVGLLLVNGFPLIPFSCVLETLRTANRLSDRDLFEWRFYSISGGPVTSNSGITVSTITLEQADDLQSLVLCASADAPTCDNPKLLHFLQMLDRQGVSLGSASFGSFILARAGLLDQFQSTVHWEYIPVFREMYPQLGVSFTLYETCERRFTCSGGTAALDMMLQRIADRHGRILAREISQYFHHDRIRTGIESQQMASRLDLATTAPCLIDVIQLMESNVEEPLPLQQIAAQCQTSLRQMQRLFIQHRGQTPRQFYLGVRLEHARQLLLTTNLRIIDIAIACGFPSQSYFAACFRKRMGCSPRNYRIRQLG